MTSYKTNDSLMPSEFNWGWGLAGGLLVAGITYAISTNETIPEEIRRCLDLKTMAGHFLTGFAFVTLLGDWAKLRRYARILEDRHEGSKEASKDWIQRGINASQKRLVGGHTLKQVQDEIDEVRKDVFSPAVKRRWVKQYVTLALIPLIGLSVSLSNLRVQAPDSPMADSFSPFFVAAVEALCLVVLLVCAELRGELLLTRWANYAKEAVADDSRYHRSEDIEDRTDEVDVEDNPASDDDDFQDWEQDEEDGTDNSDPIIVMDSLDSTDLDPPSGDLDELFRKVQNDKPLSVPTPTTPSVLEEEENPDDLV